MTRPRALIIAADDYGYRPSYDRGIVEAASAGAVDSVSVMVTRDALDPGPLLAAEVELGLHLELSTRAPTDGSWGRVARRAALAELRQQLGRFEAVFGRPAAYVDGHHHCHALAHVRATVAREARARRLPVRSVGPMHRWMLRSRGVATAHRLVGRSTEEAEALPQAIHGAIEGRGALPRGVTEWMVHPGHADPAPVSGYDRGRERDLDLLLRLRLHPALAGARCTHDAAFG